MQILSDELHGSSIKVALKDGMVPRLKVRQEQGRDRGHARSEGEGTLPLFEGGDLPADHLLVGGVEVARVEIFFRGVWEGKGRRGENRAAGTPGFKIMIGSGMNGLGGETRGIWGAFHDDSFLEND